MAPVTATSTGVARQTIDDPELTSLIERLSAYDTARASSSSAPPPAGGGSTAEGANHRTGGEGGVGGGIVESGSEAGAAALDVDGLVAELNAVPKWHFQEQADLYEWIRPLNAMDAALNHFLGAYPSLLLLPRDDVPRRTANASDASAVATFDAGGDGDGDDHGSDDAKKSVLSILDFQSRLLRNATNKSVYNSVDELSALLACADDGVCGAAAEVLCALATPPMLHRQQGPELGGGGQGDTALHRASSSLSSAGGRNYVGGEGGSSRARGGADVMWRLAMLSRGWGTRGTGLDLLRCVTLDDSTLRDAYAEMEEDCEEEEKGGDRGMGGDREAGGKDGEGDGDCEMEDADDGGAAPRGGETSSGGRRATSGTRRQSSFWKCAGEVSFECYCQLPPPPSSSGGGGEGAAAGDASSDAGGSGTLVTLHVPKEELFVSSDDEGGDGGGEGMSMGGERAEKKRRGIADEDVDADEGNGAPVASSSSSSRRALKSTARIYRECLAKIERRGQHRSRQGQADAAVVVRATELLTPKQQFALLSTVRLARSFHASSLRRRAIELRLRALACYVHADASPGGVPGYFSSQPELCGELVDLLRPTVGGGSMASGTVVAGGDGGDDNEEEKKGGEDDEGGDDEGDGGGGDAAGEGAVASSSILALADSPVVPYAVRTLALEVLTALVARRDRAGTERASTNVARQTNVLAELGVGRGQYLGLLPTLVRYSMAALNSFLLRTDGGGGGANSAVRFPKRRVVGDGSGEDDDAEDVGLQLGLAFLRATKPPPLPNSDREERGLEFIDAVLTLTSAVISVPSGTGSLTDCGIIPALVSAVALDGRVAGSNSPTDGGGERSPFCGSGSSSYSDALLKFITAQAIQILEGAIVTYPGALSAFHELNGVDVLVRRLSVEVDKVKRSAAGGGSDGDENGMVGAARAPRTLQAARRVLIFSAFNCLTVVFHQHDASPPSANAAAAPSGGSRLRKPELLNVLLEIMDNVDSYGGVLAALVATFLSDVMNSDPRVVHFVHESPLAASFLSLVMGRKNVVDRENDEGDGGEEGQGRQIAWDEEPAMEASSELLMAIPNVVTALSLTEAGAKAVADYNPFPALLSAFCSPKYVMPNSRCLLNEMAAIIGTGLDELMRHNPSLRTVCLKAIVRTMQRVASLGEELVAEEDKGHDGAGGDASAAAELEMRRTYLVQYGFNIAQLTEQILHNEDHIAPFVDLEGFTAILDLARWTLTPGGRAIVAQASCLSSSAASATHSSTSHLLAVLVKTVTANTTDPHEMFKSIVSRLEVQLSYHDGCTKALQNSNGDSLLSDVPALPLYKVETNPESQELIGSLSRLFRSVIHIDWLTQTLANSIRAGNQRSDGLGSVGRAREWKKYLASEQFEGIVDRLSALYRASIWEVSQIRTEDGFDQLDAARKRSSDMPLVYKIRIVNQEGAIVRNGIDIDMCDNVGNLEMGELAYAYDRCINSSGVLRYHTTRGWVSELTRGHGRENIAEVIDVNIRTGPLPEIAGFDSIGSGVKKRTECGIPNLRSVASSMLSRLHGSQSDLFASLERVICSGMRSQTRSTTFQSNSFGHVIAAVKILSSNLKANLLYVKTEGEVAVEDAMDAGEMSLASEAARAMYFGNQLHLLNSAICGDQQRERRINVPLLLNMLVGEGWKEGVYESTDADDEVESTDGFIFPAIRFVILHSLVDMEQKRNLLVSKSSESNSQQSERMSRAVASSLPPTLYLLRTLVSRSLLVDSPLSKMKQSDFVALISNLPQLDEENAKPTFSGGHFTRALHMKIAKLSHDVWVDSRLHCAPSHVIHPWLSYMLEVAKSLAAAAVAEPIRPSTPPLPSSRLRDSSSRTSRMLASIGLLRADQSSEPFEPSEESISQLAEMGFSREHAEEALESVGTNRVEVAMEYALTHPQSSPATLERRRAAREQRRRQRQQEQQQNDAGAESERAATTNDDNSQQDADAPNEGDATASKPTAAKEERGDESKHKPPTEEEVKAEKEKNEAARVVEYLDALKLSLVKQSMEIIAKSTIAESEDEGRESTADDSKKSKRKESDSQGVVIVMSNFLLDLCKDYPTLSIVVANELLTNIKSQLEVSSPSHCRLKSGCDVEFSFANYLHAAVIIFRSQPKLRPSVLRHGIVGMITHCVRNCTLASALHGKGRTTETQMVWPKYLAPALLLLEVMAQVTPVALHEESIEEAVGEKAKPASKKNEYGKVQSHHKKQMLKLAKHSKSVFAVAANESAGKKEGAGKKVTPSKKKKELNGKQQGESATDSKETTKETIKASEEGKSKQGGDDPNPLPSIPPLLPLLHAETAEACMMLCLQLLGLRSKKGTVDKSHLEKVCPPPAIVNAALQLLLRLFRSHELASSCFQMGGADLILSLPDRCHFAGNNHLTTFLLRRMLEDKENLLTLMMAEVRNVVVKVHKKQHPAQTSSAQPKINLKSFMQACTPLIAREPTLFVSAMASVVKIEQQSGNSSFSSSRGSQITLRSNEERLRITKALAVLPEQQSNSDKATPASSQEEENTKRRRRRSKSPHRASLSKSPKPAPPTPRNQGQGSPANHITCLLLKEIVRYSPRKGSDCRPFLSTLDLLNTLSDLVLAIPACGAALHKYKIPKDLKISNAISGCSVPSQTALSYLIHTMLPQPRITPTHQLDYKDKSNSDRVEITPYQKTKLSQATARLMVCLVARSGEGRKRVIAELAYAFGQGPTDGVSDQEIECHPQIDDAEMWAIRTWGELCMGLSAPKSSNTGTQDSNSVLSFDVVKLMLEHGMAHALMSGLGRMRLHHPMAPSTAAALVRVLEILTRPSVNNTVTEMVEKEKVKLDSVKTGNRRVTFGPSGRSESSFAHDVALDSAFDAAADTQDGSDNSDVEEEDEIMSEEENSDMVEVPRMDFGSDGSGDEEVSSDENSSEEESDDVSEEDLEEDDDEDDDDDVDDDEDNSEFEEHDGEDELLEGEGEEEEAWGLDNNEFFDGNAEEGGNNNVPNLNDDVEDGMEEGWTRIEGGQGSQVNREGLGNILMETLHGRGGGPFGGGGLADNLLGNLLRGGEMGDLGLEEIERSLGIRIVQRNTTSGLSRGISARVNPGSGSEQGIVYQSSPCEGFSYGNSVMDCPTSWMEQVFDNQEPSSENEGSSQITSENVDYDTQLFPGGLAASTNTQAQQAIHPMLRAIQLPPVNSLVSNVSAQEDDTDAQEQTAASTAFFSRTGQIIRVSGRERQDRLPRRANRPTLMGWVDDGLPQDQTTDEYSQSFGQFIEEMQQQSQINAQNERSNETEDVSAAPENDQSEPGTPELNGREGDAADTEDTAAPSDTADSSNNEAPAAAEPAQPETNNGTPAEETQSEEMADSVNTENGAVEESQSDAAEVSNAMATGLAISQPVSDSTPTLPHNSNSTAQASASANSGGNNGTDDIVMAEDDAAEDGAGGGDETAENATGNNVNENMDEEATEEDEQDEQEGGRQGEEATGGPDEAAEAAAEAAEAAVEADEAAEAAVEAAEANAGSSEEGNVNLTNNENASGEEQLTCPPDIDQEVFDSLPPEMQQEIVQQHQEAADISESGLDPEALAALPEEMRREVIAQEREQQRQREQQATEPAADPANAEEMDNASFLASLAPDLRQEILLTGDDAFIASLPPQIIAEANVLRERASQNYRRRVEETSAPAASNRPNADGGATEGRPAQPSEGAKRRQRNGKLRVESDRTNIIFTPEGENLGPLITVETAKAFLSIFYMLSPVQPQRVIHKLTLNMCLCSKSRTFILNALVCLLKDDKRRVLELFETLKLDDEENIKGLKFPPFGLIGSDLNMEEDNEPTQGNIMFRRQGNSVSTSTASLPLSSRGSSQAIPPVVSRRIVSLMSSLCKSSPRLAFSMLYNEDGTDGCPTCLDSLIDLFELDQYASPIFLEQLLSLLEVVVAPLSLLPKDEIDVDLESPASTGREWVKVPRVEVGERRLSLLVNTLRLDIKDTSFAKINTITRRLCRVEANRDCILRELAGVAADLGRAAILDLKAVSVRLSAAAKHHQKKLQYGTDDGAQADPSSENEFSAGTPSSAVSLSTSNSELKLFRVLQMLSALCEDSESEPKGEGFTSLVQSLDLEPLWDQLSANLRVVSVLEGVSDVDVLDEEGPEDNDDGNETAEDVLNGGKGGKKLKNSVAGLITRFLPAIQAFFLTESQSEAQGEATASSRTVKFAASNKVLLNALLRSNPSLLEKGLKSMVKNPKCRLYLDFDVKRQWFKTQVRRLRQQASRRHGSFRLNLRRKTVFEDSFHAFVHRNADEIRGRLHITFQSEEGVDAGGVSREFFEILAKEMFNPNYALFMSTEDGCTFQPNPNSSINPDDLRYFKFVGRIVGKAVADGFLLDAHFTRSLYKHMLGIKPDVADMQAIDPDYYKNLQMILEHNLDDIGLELTFSTDDHSFGRSRTIDLIPDGRNTPVTDETKERYVDLVCQHRMTTAIEKQIKSFLEGWHEMVDPELISIFSPKELELLISGLPEVDIHDLKKHTDYNGYRPADKEIGWFWNILFNLTRSEKAAFLQFVTGSSKVPLAGFSQLQGMRGVQQFSINKASGSSGALMCAHTCFNALDLPVYKSEEEMKEKLLYAISEGLEGFGFA